MERSALRCREGLVPALREPMSCEDELALPAKIPLVRVEILCLERAPGCLSEQLLLPISSEIDHG
jgi:hypothetical protein